MKYKKSILILMLAIFLFTISAVNAMDVNDTSVSSVNADHMILSLNNEITYDNLQISENNTLTEANNGESTYSQLAREIGSGGNIILSHDYYTYDSGSTINIGVENSVIDGNGAVIDMAGSTNMRAFYVSASGVTIKNLTIINAIYNGDGGSAIYFHDSGTVTNCNFVNNSASSYCGAIRFIGEGAVINCNFTNNKVARDYGYGGAVCFSSTGTVTICNFVNNTASKRGGSLYFSSNCEVTICNFVNNTASEEGGAVYFLNTCNVSNCNFTNNKVTGGHNCGGEFTSPVIV